MVDKLFTKITKNNTRIFILIAAISLILILITGYKILFRPGVIILAENLEVYSLDSLLENFGSFWQDKYQYYDFGIEKAMYLYSTFVFLGKHLGLSYELIQRLLILLPHGLSFASMFYLIRYILINHKKDEINENSIIIISILTAVVYSFNPWIAIQPRDVPLRFIYSLLPLALLFYIKTFTGKKKFLTTIIIFGLVFSFIASFRMLFVVFPMFLIYILIPDYENKEVNLFSRINRALLMVFLIGLFTAGKFLAPLLYSANTDVLPYINNFHVGMIGQSSLVEILTGKVINSIYRNYVDNTYLDSSYLLFGLITVFSLTYLIYTKKKYSKNEVYFPVVLISYLPFIILSNEPFGDFSKWFLTEVPFSNLYGRVLRFADWNYLPVLISFTVMFAFSLKELFILLKKVRTINILKSALILSTIIVCTLSSWPLLTGDLNGYWKPSEIPREYLNLNDSLKKDTADYHVLIVPGYWDNKAKWAGNKGIFETSSPTCNFDVRTLSKPGFLPEHFYFFDYYNAFGQRSWFYPLDGYNGNHLNKIYKSVNIKYLVYHDDISLHPFNELINDENHQTKVRIEAQRTKYGNISVKEDGFMTIFQIHESPKRFNAVLPVCSFGGLPTLGSFADIGLDFGNISFVFADGNIGNNNNLKDLLKITPFISVKGSSDPVKSTLIREINPNSIISFYKYTFNDNPKAGWSRATFQNGVGDSRFQETLTNMNIKKWSWDFDFDRGVIFTTKQNSLISIPYNVQDEGDYTLLLRYFNNIYGGTIKMIINNDTIYIKADGKNNSYDWELVPKVRLNKGLNNISVINVNGFNSLNLMAFIKSDQYLLFTDKINNILGTKSCFYILEAENDFETDRNLVKSVDEKNASNGSLIEFEENGIAKLNINILRSDYYDIILKIKNDFNMLIDSSVYFISNNNLDYYSIKSIYLSEGKHEIAFVSLKDGSQLDVMLLYNSNSIDSLITLSKNINSDVILNNTSNTGNYSYDLNVKNNFPFLLTDAVGFDPKMKAVSGNRNWNSIAVNGLISGYIIDQSGDYTMKISYTPQIWANTGSTISIISIFISILYVATNKILLRKRKSNQKIVSTIRKEISNNGYLQNHKLSVVIPVYQEAKILENTIELIDNYLKALKFDFEIIIADDGSTDNTSEVIERIMRYNDKIKYMREMINKGRGYVLTKAIKQSSGDIVCYIDADLQINFTIIKELFEQIVKGYDIAIASKHLEGSNLIYSIWRKCQSRTYNKITSLLFGLNIKDYQCGAKAFNRRKIFPVFKYIYNNRWSWDTEILIKSTLLKLKIIEIPANILTTERKSSVKIYNAFTMGYKLLQLWIWYRTNKEVFVNNADSL